jgi:Zn-dependent peptidase ImmA (M78 family)
VIGVAPAVPGDRFRLTLSHEVAHLVLHARKTELAEREANRFAGALLFPADDFDLAMTARPLLSDFIALKSAWGISVAALVYRAHELGYVDDSRYRALQIQMAKWRKNEPGTFEPAHGQLLPRLVELNGGVDAGAADLGVNPRRRSNTSRSTSLNTICAVGCPR